jgi:hypothetical protein
MGPDAIPLGILTRDVPLTGGQVLLGLRDVLLAMLAARSAAATLRAQIAALTRALNTIEPASAALRGNGGAALRRSPEGDHLRLVGVTHERNV